MNFEALNFVPMPVVVLERTKEDTFAYVWMNPAAKTFSGFDLDLIGGKTPREVFPGRAGEQLAARQEAAALKGRQANYLYPLTLPNGEVWIETSLVPVRGEDGSMFRLVATMQDRTAERLLQEQKINSEIQMKKMEQDIESYIAMAAHDLKTPMRHVKQIADMLREDFVDYGDGKLELIESLERVGVTAHELISDVLGFARASSSEAPQSIVDLEVLTADIFSVLDPHQSFDMSSDKGILETDAIALQIAFRNLIDNTVKHAGAEHVSISVELLGEKDGMLNFKVSDTGRGFDDPAIAFLDGGEFKYDSGFGLLGVKRIISSRGGEISAKHPETGTGAQIVFTLPGRICTSGTQLTACGQMPATSAIRIAAA